MIKSLKHLAYSDRLKNLNLPTLNYRRHRGDMIEVYKIVTKKYSEECCTFLTRSNYKITRGNRYNLEKGHIRYDARKYSFSCRVITLWNSLPDIVVSANSTNAFKNRLDKYWSTQELIYNWKANITGTGSRSFK